MKKTLPIFILMMLISFYFSCSNQEKNPTKANASMNPTQKANYALVIHGGAGVIKKEDMSDEREANYLKALNEALDIGEGILKSGGSSMDAVEKTIIYLENNPLFNAGKGAVFTNAGTNELDASFMDGKTQNAGAVGGVTKIKNPIKAARLVLEKSPHVLLTGSGANTFAIENGLETVPPEYFYTERRWKSMEKAKAKENKKSGSLEVPVESKFGTVGCVALDKNGNLAAGTSTGGMTNKKYGRLGDSPIIAAGTYADNNTCAISCTGHGEYFIRYVVAYDVSARMAYLKETLKTAADFVVNKKLVGKGGSGGLIGVDKFGNVAMPFNSDGMFRGYAKPEGRKVLIYGE